MVCTQGANSLSGEARQTQDFTRYKLSFDFQGHDLFLLFLLLPAHFY